MLQFQNLRLRLVRRLNERGLIVMCLYSGVNAQTFVHLSLPFSRSYLVPALHLDFQVRIRDIFKLKMLSIPRIFALVALLSTFVVAEDTALPLHDGLSDSLPSEPRAQHNLIPRNALDTRDLLGRQSTCSSLNKYCASASYSPSSNPTPTSHYPPH